MKMKRLVSALLCVMLLWTSTAAFADPNEATPSEATPCTHENQTTTTTIEEESYAEDGAHAHVHSYTEVVTVDCPDCEAGDSVTRTAKTESLPHQYDANGYCSVCGYTCPHENKTETEEIRDGWYNPASEYAHQYVYTVIHHATCEDCGAALPDTQDQQQEEQNHVFDANGVCKTCSYACVHAMHDMNGVCNICGAACTHSYMNGSCTVCGASCPHLYDEKGVCKTCGMACVHSYDEKGVCTVCGYACAHPQEYLGYNNYREQVTGYTAEGYSGHSVIYDLLKDAKCLLCGATIETGLVDTSGCLRWEDHTYVDGVCSLCGGKACDHPGMIVSCSQRNHVFTPLDAQYHTQTYDVYESKACELCFTILGEEIIEKGRSDKAAHIFREDGVCHVCGYQNTCAHAHTALMYEDDYSNAYQEKQDATYHLFVYQSKGVTFCTDCGAKLTQIEPVVTEVRKQQRHYFSPDDGICYACGEKNVCTHPSTRVESYIYGSYTAVDETYCTQTGTRMTQTYCSDCGMLIKTEEEENATKKIEHSFRDGVCSHCGYIPECSHERTYAIESQKFYAWDVPKDDKVHVDYYNLYEVTHCADCGRILSQKLIEQSCEKPEAHDGDGKCACGYVNLCEHQNIKKEYYDSDGTKYTRIDEKTHWAEYDSYSYDVCADCGKDLGNEQLIEHVKVVDEHYYYDGVCDCGDVSGCQHEHIRTQNVPWSVGSRKLDQKYHVMIVNWYEETLCADCGESISQKLIKAGDEIRIEHNYNSVGVCNECGYVNNACKHETVSTSVTWNTDSAQVVSKDENGHTVTYDVIKTTHCYDCGLDTTEVLAQGQTVTEPHDSRYWDGVCIVCSYQTNQPVCEHPSTEEVVTYECQSILSTDEHEHKMRAVKIVDTYCAECGTWIQMTREPDQIVTEAHDFYLDKCLVCDYKNPCKHAKTHTETYYSRPYNFTSTADSHTFKGDLWEMTICDVCDSIIAETLKEFDGTFTEEHYADDKGVCVVCGYKGSAPVNPEPTPGPTAKPAHDTDNTFVPTPRPQTNSVVEATVEPTATPAPQAMVDTLLDAVLEAQAEGSEVTIEVVGAAEIMTEEEYAALKALPAQEQILVTLASIGFEDVVEAAMKALNVTLSDGAQALVGQVTERMAAVSEEERTAIEEKLAEYFPVEEVVIDGVRTSYFVIDLRIEVDGVVRVERYGFRLDENGEWIFVKLDLQSVQW